MYPTWSDGKQVGRHRRDFTHRYEAIRHWLTVEGRRGFTVLDFGAGGGYFAARLTEDFNATVAAVECDPKARQALEATGVTVIPRHLTPQDIGRLGHFDVVLALSVLHHQTDWKPYLQVLLNAGDVVFIETAHPAENLPRAVGHCYSQAIRDAVAKVAAPLRRIPGYDHRYERTLWVVRK